MNRNKVYFIYSTEITTPELTPSKDLLAGTSYENETTDKEIAIMDMRYQDTGKIFCKVKEEAFGNSDQQQYHDYRFLGIATTLPESQLDRIVTWMNNVISRTTSDIVFMKIV